MNKKLAVGSEIRLIGREWTSEFGDEAKGGWTVAKIDEEGLVYFSDTGDYGWDLTFPDDPDWGWEFVADAVDRPTHYQHPSGIEVIDITRHESFLRGNVLKYVLRAPYKNNELEDLKKAAKYLAWEIDRVGNDAEAR